MESNQVADQETAIHESEQALEATQESLDKVRDILVGSQLRQQDARFSQLEEKINAQLSAFREETRKQLETLQNFVKGEVNAATTALASESQQRQEAFSRLADELRGSDRSLSEKLDNACRALGDENKATFNTLSTELNNKAGHLEGRISTVDQATQGAASVLRGQLLDATNKLRDESRQWQHDLQSIVEKLVAELRSAKTDRTALATLFSEMAGRLQG
jgi:hypothetical protein